MDDRTYQYYKKMGYKCFDIFHLLDIIFPPENGLEEKYRNVYETIAYAIKENNYILMNEAGDILYELGLIDWSNHVHKIARGIKKQYLSKSNSKKEFKIWYGKE